MDIDDQVRIILSKSQLSEGDVEHIWELTTTIDAEGLPDGKWTQLEVYVALHFVQKYEKLSLDQIAAQFAGPIPLVAKKITRRSSYAQAKSSTSSAADPVIRPAQSSALLRAQSLVETPVPPTARLLRHSRFDSSATIRLRGTPAYQTLSDHDDSSVSQAGLEALDAITETQDWEEQQAPTQSTPFRIRSSHRNDPSITESLEGTSRGSSIPSAGRVQNSGVPTEHQKVSSCKPPKLNDKTIHDKMLGGAISLVKLIYNFIAENFVVMVVIQELLRYEKNNF